LPFGYSPEELFSSLLNAHVSGIWTQANVRLANANLAVGSIS